MALKRSFLSAMGIEEDKIEQIISAHTETVNGLKEEIDQYKADALKLPEIQKELEEVKSQIKDPEKDPYKLKYEALKEEFKGYKEEIENAKVKTSKENAYRNLLKEAGVSDKRIESVLRVSDFEKIELDADGKVKDSDSLLDGIKTEWADFIVTKQTQGANTDNPPANNSGSSFETMSLAEKMVYANEHAGDEAVKAWLNKE